MTYLCPACGWKGEMSGDPWPCPDCGVGDADFPLIELKENLVVEGRAEYPLLECRNCGEVNSALVWIDNEERCPKCNSHDAKVLPPEGKS
jgi:rubrerythrin